MEVVDEKEAYIIELCASADGRPAGDFHKSGTGGGPADDRRFLFDPGRGVGWL